MKAFVRICNRLLNPIIQIHIVFQTLGIELTIILFQVLVIGADDEDDEEVVFPLDWYVVFEY